MRIEKRTPSRLGRLLSREQPELQLSEALALVLDATPELAIDLLRKWTENGENSRLDPASLSIQTELRIDRAAERTPGQGNRRIDLAVSADGDRPATLWIEIKWGLRHESSKDQVRAYAEELDHRYKDEDRALGVAYLTDVGVRAPEFDVQGVNYLPITWREFFEGMLRRHHRSPVARDFGRWLEEVGLVLDPVEEGDLVALARFRRARDRMTAVLETAAAEISRYCRDELEFEAGDPHPGFKTWVANWGDHCFAPGRLPPDLPPELHDSMLLEWNLRARTESSGFDDGTVVFAAGLTWRDENVTAWSPCEQARQDLLGRNSSEAFSEYEDDHPRLYRWFDPAGLPPAGTSVGDQADVLAGFVKDAYADALEALRRSCSPGRD